MTMMTEARSYVSIEDLRPKGRCPKCEYIDAWVGFPRWRNGSVSHGLGSHGIPTAECLEWSCMSCSYIVESKTVAQANAGAGE